MTSIRWRNLLVWLGVPCAFWGVVVVVALSR